METKISKYLKDAHYMIGALLKDHKAELPAHYTLPYTQGTLVHIAEDTEEFLHGLEVDKNAIVLETQYNGNWKYALFVLHTNSEGEIHGHHSAWYPHELLIKLEAPTDDSLQVVEYAAVVENMELDDDEDEDFGDDYEQIEEEEE